MDISVLGPLRVEGPAGQVEIRGAKERLLLARLVAAAGRLVPTSDLVDTLWGDDPPASAGKSLQTFVVRLRNALEAERHLAPTLLLTEGPGYRLAIDHGQVDAERFARLATMGHRALADGRPDSAHRTLTEALTLWRGPAYAGFEGADFARAEARRLHEVRLGATEDRLACELALGRTTEAVPDLERLVVEHPTRERLWDLLVTALYRAGRQGDALAAYEGARTILADELGVAPGAALRSTHARVLAHDPSLGSPTTVGATIPPALRPSGPLVGRGTELARLREAWQRALRGRPTTVVVRGPAGGGATALASAFAAEAARDGAVVRYVGPVDPPSPTPPGPPTAPVLLVLDHADRAQATERDHDGPAGPTLTLRLVGHLAAVPEGAEVLDLVPLSPREVREVVAEHVAPGEVDGVTAEVLARSGGWPGAVHDVSAELARARARRRVEVAVALSGSSSADLAAARADIADGVASLAGSGPQEGAPDPGECPWRGLAAYDVDDARWYAGRERLVAEVVARMPGSRLLALVGASGSGKSSLMRAGLLAALQRDVLPGSATWRVVTLRPGPHPMAELARRALGSSQRADMGDLLRHLAEGDPVTDDRVVLAVDQLEEAWTVCQDEAERRQFLDALADLATDPRSCVTVVVAVRADYLSGLADHDELRALVGGGTVLVGPLTAPEIRRTLERPAATARLTFDDGLADTIVADAGQEPGLLPLLSTAMAQLWQRRQNGRLTYPAYVALGGLDGAITTLAEEAYTNLSRTQQATARVLLLRLTGPGDGAGVSRRRVATKELEALPTEGIGSVVEHLARARLLTLADGTVEVAHEALFREWPRLRGWLTEDAAGRAVQRRLAVAAAEWDADGREQSALWAGTRLASGLEAADARPAEVTSTERDFLEASRDAVEAQQRMAEERARATGRQNRRLRWLLAGVGVVLVAALVAGTAAWRSQRTAEAASLSAEAKRLAASALNIEYPDVALLAAVEATRLEQSPETFGALLTLLARQPHVLDRMRVEGHFQRIGASPDGRTIYLSEVAPRIRAVDAESGRVLWDRDMPEDGQVGDVIPTADGTGIVVTEYSEDPGVVRLDAATGEVVWAARAADLEKAAPGAAPWVLRGGLTSDGRYLVTTDSHVFTLDVGSGAVTGAAAWPEPLPSTPYVVVWPDGRVSRDRPDDTTTGLLLDPVHPERGAVQVDGIPRSVSPDGSRVVLVREADGVTDLRIARAEDLGESSPWVRTPSHVNGAAWSPDGTRLVITTDDGIQLLDPETLRLGTRSVGHSGEVVDARFAGPASDLVWTAGRDGTAVAFDLSGRRTPIATRPADPDPHVGASSPTSQRGVYLDMHPNDPNTAYVTDLATGRHLGQLVHDVPGTSAGWAPGTEFQVVSVAIAPDGSSAFVGVEGLLRDQGPVTERGALVSFDTATQQQRAVIDLPWRPHGIAVSPDGRRAVVNGGSGYAVVDLADERLVGPPVAMDEMRTVHWTEGAEVSPDGRTAALARNDEVVLVDVATGGVVHRARVTEAEDSTIQALEWSADSRTVLAGSTGGWLHVLSGTTLQPVAPRRLITGGWVTDLETGPDGRVLASTGFDGDVTLWDTATWRPYGQPLTDDRGWAWLTFTPDGRRLRVFFEKREVVEISTDPTDWVTAACAAAGRNLTPAESAVILPGRTPTATCPSSS